jgi:hypothetical protein
MSFFSSTVEMVVFLDRYCSSAVPIWDAARAALIVSAMVDDDYAHSNFAGSRRSPATMVFSRRTARRRAIGDGAALAAAG